ncbi:PREDICTED: uncharacterized protein LOC104605525 isoform X2 [Nelumbo nucifera]|uniref:Uncharacterized protein LOC104605525 isoform X2 n=1 Tax=Nelumbo nucifera TaxID=4432 RepID=A0A1U8ALI5_NELNU|nr:PREDICTED: uncharacterized protein LOC104605525 isoform X2 [Nelumbo nucifera]
MNSSQGLNSCSTESRFKDFLNKNDKLVIAFFTSPRSQRSLNFEPLVRVIASQHPYLAFIKIDGDAVKKEEALQTVGSANRRDLMNLIGKAKEMAPPDAQA